MHVDYDRALAADHLEQPEEAENRDRRGVLHNHYLRSLNPEEHQPSQDEKMDENPQEEVEEVWQLLNDLEPAIWNAYDLDLRVLFDFLIGFSV